MTGTNLPRVLIVEDDALIAMLAEDMLAECQCEVAGVAATVREALSAIEAGGVDAAMLDVQLSEGTSMAVATELRARGIPFLFTTGGSEGIDPAHSDVPLLLKPYMLAEFKAALARCLD